MKRYRFIRAILVGFVSLAICTVYLRYKLRALETESQMVFTDAIGLGHELVMDIAEGKLIVRTAELRTGDLYAFVVDGNTFLIDREKTNANYQKYAINHRLAVRSDRLYFDDALVTLPDGVQIRNIWQSILWKGWVICIARTSKTDTVAKLEPPFFASELIAFDARRRVVADVRYLTFHPPSLEPRLLILSPKKSN